MPKLSEIFAIENLYIIGAVVIFYLCGYFINWLSNLRKNVKEVRNSRRELNEKENNLLKQKTEIDKSFINLNEREKEIQDKSIKTSKSIEKSFEKLKNEEINLIERSKQINQAIDKMIQEKVNSFPWLAKLVADYYDVLDNRLVNYLESKKHPAMRAADTIREIKIDKRNLELNYRTVRYTLEYYESLFPTLLDYKDDGLDELSQSIIDNSASEIFEEEYDPAYDWLTTDEYNNLTQSEKYQRALDNYLRKSKSKWQIGKIYERFIGYTYEMKGYSVIYQGIKLRFEDLGIDLICSKPDETLLIQCKYWNQNKLIREASVNQLFGTSVKYTLEKYYENRQIPFLYSNILSNYNVLPIIITSTKLSDTANKFAKALGIIVKENVPFEKYPMIKCNINRQTGEKIFHLPFDQQYDNTIVEFERGEYYALTVAEAERNGFRRAYRWRGN